MAGTKVGKNEDSTIVVTGASGFLGQFIVRQLLTEGYRVKALVRRAAERSFSWQQEAELVDADVLDILALQEAFEGAYGVIHAAARVSFKKQDHADIRAANIGGTENVVNACLQTGVTRLVHISSIAAIGKALPDTLATEETPWQPGQSPSVYAQSKRLAELQVYRGIAEGLHATMVNPGIILGPTNDWSQSSMELFRQAAEGLQVYQRGISSLVGAEDVAKACTLLLRADVTAGERYILVAENMSTLDMLNRFAQSVGRPGPRIRIPGWLSLNAARIVERLNPRASLTAEAVLSGLSQDAYDGNKITQLGFTYTPISEVVAAVGTAYKAR